MTSRERVLAALEGRPVDRLPHDTPFLASFTAAWHAQTGHGPEVDIERHYGIDIGIPTADETPFPSRAEVLESGPAGVVRRDGWGRTIRERPGAYFYEVVANAGTSADEILAAEFEDPAADRRYESYLHQVEHCRRHQLAGFAKIGGPYLRTTFWRGEVEYLTDIAADPRLARELADKMADHLLAIALESLRRGGDTKDVGMSMWDDIAYNSGPFFSRPAFERIFMPGYARIVAGCKAAGARYFFFHSDGNINPLLPCLAEIGVDIINPIEPRAGMDVLALSEEYHGRLAFIGGLDNSGVMCFGTPDDVRAHVAPVARAARDRGGLICGMHSVEGDVPLANYEAYWETVMSA